MRRINTHGIVLARTDYAEADRILTLLTPDNGKIKAIAKGVRKQKSKIAGGIELFSVSEISYIIGKSEINTLISGRLVKHYGNIVKDLERTGLAYELIKLINKATEDNTDKSYFDLLKSAFEALDDALISLDLISAWFSAQLLKLGGHSPNLRTEQSGTKLQANQTYEFNFDSVAFHPSENGRFNADQIKFLRLIFSHNSPQTINKVQGLDSLLVQSAGLVRTMLQTFIRV